MSSYEQKRLILQGADKTLKRRDKQKEGRSMLTTEKRLRHIIKQVIKETYLNEMDRMDFYQDARQQHESYKIELEKAMTKDEWKDFNASQYKDAIERSKNMLLSASGGFGLAFGSTTIGMLVKLIPMSIAIIPSGIAISFFGIFCLALRKVIEELEDSSSMSRAREVEKRQKEIDRLEKIYQKYYEKTSQNEKAFIADMHDIYNERGSFYVDDKGSMASYEHQKRWAHMPKPKLDINKLRK